MRAAPGGRHPDLGTRNALARLTPRTYLEVIAPDPTLAAGQFARRLAALARPALAMWAARTTDAAATARRAEAAGYRAVVIDGHRPRPDGEVLRWRSVFVSGHGAGILVPFFIEWTAGEHPARDAPSGLTLRAFRVETPRPASLGAVFDALDVSVPVRPGERDRLVAELDTPEGAVELDGPAA